MNHIKSGSHTTACSDIQTAIDMGLDASLEGRAYSMLAQSQLALELYSEARQSLRRAIRAAHDMGDKDVLPSLNQMMANISGGIAKDNIIASRRERQAKVHETYLSDLLEGISDHNDRLNITLEKADSLALAGHPEQAIALAEKVFEASQGKGGDTLRYQVLALIAIANAAPDSPGPILERARAIADGAGEFRLITAVVKAAKSLNYIFSAKVF